ncbi:MAG: valine--tRNA ligase [Bacteroidia bacterium]|jgi:valyl-tRNA synthetase|nr:valine--tRNA ligase [Bacteroidia bacterium]
MNSTIASKYSPQHIEEKWYAYWLQHKYFKSIPDKNKEPFTIVIPPPNVTGVLHMGHMLNNTIQDALTRRARMQGKNALWVPGTDHASIATEAKVVQMLREKGIKKSDLTRDEFLTYAWEWKEKYGGIILKQLEKLGAGCDWDRTRFTMEPKLSEAVIDTFIDLYEKGLIYRELRMVNWDPQGKTALSDEEVIFKDVQSKLYFIRYYFVDEPSQYLTIATTRPETILADTAICVHPGDERFKQVIGKQVLIPFINRSIPVIADEYVDMEFGTGCLKVTPAHDKNDYELGKKHNLEVIDILTEEGFLNASAVDERYIGKDRFAVRKQIAIDLEEAGYIVKIEEYKNQVGTSERTGAVIEPRLTLQWWVDMKKFISRNPQVLDAVMNDEIKFHPANMKNTYKHWIDNIKDWCISRQLWWGQRIPAWYDENGNYVVAKTQKEALAKYEQQYGTVASLLQQDEDVVDTWFSSWLWPISVFDGFEGFEGGKIKLANTDLGYYYPTNDLVTAPEIMFFWVARMIMAGYEWMGQKPFNNVYYTGIVRDKLRRKMSKSLGNSPDPLDLIATYGADAIRMGMLLSSPAGNDILYDEAQVEQGRNFANKIWNAFRLVKGWEVVADEDTSAEILASNQLSSAWFEVRMNNACEEINAKYEDYKLSEVLMTIYKLIWDDFCSWYLEMIKPEYGKPINQSALNNTVKYFDELMRLLHPFMPFITEEIWQNISTRKEGESICISPYPEVKTNLTKGEDLALVFELIQQIRNLRNSKGISPKQTLDIAIKTQHPGQYNQALFLIKKLANLHTIEFVDTAPMQTILVQVHTDEVYVKLELQLDKEAEREKVENEIAYLNGFLQSVNAKLANEKFVANAKPDLVEKERRKKADAEAKIAVLNQSLQSLI